MLKPRAKQNTTSLGEKIVTIITVLLVLAAGYVVFEFAWVFIAMKDFLQ